VDFYIMAAVIERAPRKWVNVVDQVLFPNEQDYKKYLLENERQLIEKNGHNPVYVGYRKFNRRDLRLYGPNASILTLFVPKRPGFPLEDRILNITIVPRNNSQAEVIRQGKIAIAEICRAEERDYLLAESYVIPTRLDIGLFEKIVA
jgi:hypothetical protein